MPNLLGGDAWIWTAQMDDWFLHQFLRTGPEERGREPCLPDLLPRLPNEIRLEEALPLLWGDLLV